MLYLNCTMISSVDLAHFGVSHAIDLWIVDNCFKTNSSYRRVPYFFFIFEQLNQSLNLIGLGKRVFFQGKQLFHFYFASESQQKKIGANSFLKDKV